MRKLIVSDSIRAARDLFFEHITGIPQVDTRSRLIEIQPTLNPLPRSRYGTKNRNTVNQSTNPCSGGVSFPGELSGSFEPGKNSSPDCDLISPDNDSSLVFKNVCIPHVNTRPNDSPGLNPRGEEGPNTNTGN